jgi:PBP1b-binding outer membrane lipoprotein LpoB
MTRLFVIAALAAFLGGCSGAGSGYGSLASAGGQSSYPANQSRTDCFSATPEEIAADAAQPRPLCEWQRERLGPDGT